MIQAIFKGDRPFAVVGWIEVEKDWRHGRSIGVVISNLVMK